MNNDLKQLTKYSEFYALKQELLKFCDKMDNIGDIDTSNPSRVSLSEEIIGRRYASDKVKELLINLGMLETSDLKKKDQTFE